MECPRPCTLQDDFMAIALLMFIMLHTCSFATITITVQYCASSSCERETLCRIFTIIVINISMRNNIVLSCCHCNHDKEPDIVSILSRPSVIETLNQEVIKILFHKTLNKKFVDTVQANGYHQMKYSSNK